MRKSIFVLCILLAGGFAALCGCAPVSSAESPDADAPAAAAQPSDAQTVTVADIIATEPPPQYAGMDVVESTGIVEWAQYPFPENMVSLADAVVYGTVTGKEYVNFGADAWTKFDFTAEQTLLGEAPAAPALTIYSSGGYLSQYDQLMAEGTRARVPDRTDAQLQNTIVHEHADYHFDPLVGSKYILFLTHTPPDTALPTDSYQIVGARFCQLCETAPGTFSYIAFGPDPDDPDAVFSPDDPVVQMTRSEVEALLGEAPPQSRTEKATGSAAG